MNQSISTKIRWELPKEEFFTKGQYSRSHTWELDSGNIIQASTSPHIVPIPYSNPEFIDPEEAFLCSLASCHMLFFLSFAAKKKMEVLQYLDAPEGILTKNSNHQIAFTEILLQPKIITKEEVSKERLEKLHQLAHQNCFIANSLKSKIQIQIKRID